MIRFSIKLLLTVLLLGLVLHAVDLVVFWKTIRSADIKLLSVAIVLFFPGKLLDAYRWYFLLKQLDRILPFWSIVRHSMLGQLSALFLPGQISGDVVRIIAVTRGQYGKTTFVLSVILDKLVLLCAVVIFVLLGILGSGPVSQFAAVYPATLGLLVVALLTLIFLCRYRRDDIPPRLIRLSNRLPFARRYMLSLTEWLSLPRISLQRTFIVLALGLGLQLIYTVSSYLMALSMCIVINPVDWAAINAIVSLIQVFPLTIGGLGVREGVCATILALYAVPFAQATAFSLTGFVAMASLTVFGWFALNSFYLRPLAAAQ